MTSQSKTLTEAWHEAMTSKMLFGGRDVASFFRKAKPPIKQRGNPEQTLSLMVQASQSHPTARNKLINIRKARQRPVRILKTTKDPSKPLHPPQHQYQPRPSAARTRFTHGSGLFLLYFRFQNQINAMTKVQDRPAQDNTSSGQTQTQYPFTDGQQYPGGEQRCEHGSTPHHSRTRTRSSYRPKTRRGSRSGNRHSRA
jgi:hypothetical protein